jgi:hypothetical protein
LLLQLLAPHFDLEAILGIHHLGEDVLLVVADGLEVEAVEVNNEFTDHVGADREVSIGSGEEDLHIHEFEEDQDEDLDTGQTVSKPGVAEQVGVVDDVLFKAYELHELHHYDVVHGETGGEFGEVESEVLDVYLVVVLAIVVLVVVELKQQTRDQSYLKQSPDDGFPQDLGLTELRNLELGDVGDVERHDGEPNHVPFEHELLVLAESELSDHLKFLNLTLLLQLDLLLLQILLNHPGFIHLPPVRALSAHCN